MSCRQTSRPPPATVAPLFTLVIEPAAIPKVQDITAVWASALLATPFRAVETNGRRELRPIDRVKPALLRTDRHQAFTRGASAR